MLAAAVIVSGCAGGGAEEASEQGSVERRGTSEPAHGQERGPRPLDAPGARALDAYAGKLRRAHTARSPRHSVTRMARRLLDPVEAVIELLQDPVDSAAQFG